MAAVRWLQLQRLREGRGHTRLSLAGAVGCHVSTISRVEAGICRPRPPLFNALAVELRCDVEDLINQCPKRTDKPLAVAS